MKIGFFDYCLNFRGTTRAILEYSKAIMRSGISQDCTIFFERKNRFNILKAAKLFLQHGIAVQPLESKDDLADSRLDFLYHVSSGNASSHAWLDGIRCSNTLLHQVGYNPPEVTTDTRKFAYTSYWQSYHFSGCKSKVLPYIVNFDASLALSQKFSRSQYGIPADAIVLGRLGGYDTWNLEFVSRVISDVSTKLDNVYFLFMNTPNFLQSPNKNVIFLKGTHDAAALNCFFSACDAMLHARWEGETFGMACAEFLFRRKPVITWSESRERNHILMANSSLIAYNTSLDLRTLLSGLTREYLLHKASLIDLSSLSSLYSPNAVIPILMKFVYA